MSIKNYLEEQLKDPTFKEEYFKYDLAYEIGELITEARLHKGLTQEQLDQACGDDKTELPEVPKQPFLDSLTIKPCRDLKATAD